MASSKRYESSVVDLGWVKTALGTSKKWHIVIRTPLTEVANPYATRSVGYGLGFIGYFMYQGYVDQKPNEKRWPETEGYPPGLSLGYASNGTYWMKGSRRALKGQTQSYRRMTLTTNLTHAENTTYYGENSLNRPPEGMRGTQLRSMEDQWINSKPFPLAEFFTLLRGIVERQNAYPLADWFVENAPEVGKVMSQPVWLPNTFEEFATEKKARHERYEARMAATT